MRILYRVRQFWSALTAVPDSDDLESARRVLSPDLMTLFLRMQPSEQAHSLKIFQRLNQQGQPSEDLLVAALLHDVGKSCHPLHIWERVLIVLANKLFPGKVWDWGNGEPYGWRRPFVIAKQHPAWGADLAAEAGASPLAVSIIRRHQKTPDPTPGDLNGTPLELTLINQLQLLDEES